MSLLPIGTHQGYGRGDVAGKRSVHDLSAPADASGRAPVTVPPPAPSYGDFKMSEAQPSTDAIIDQQTAHRDSVLTDKFNALHYGQNEVDKAQADSARIAGNIETLKGAPQATGSENVQATTPEQRMAKRKNLAPGTSY